MPATIKHLQFGNIKIGSYWWQGRDTIVAVENDAVIAKCKGMLFLHKGKVLPRFEILSQTAEKGEENASPALPDPTSSTNEPLRPFKRKKAVSSEDLLNKESE